MKKVLVIIAIVCILAIGGVVVFNYLESSKLKTELSNIVYKTMYVKEKGINSYTIKYVTKTDGDIAESIYLKEVDVLNGIQRKFGKDTQDGIELESVTYESLEQDGKLTEYIRWYEDSGEERWHKNEISMNTEYDEVDNYFDIGILENIAQASKVKKVESDLSGTIKYEVFFSTAYLKEYYEDEDDYEVISEAKYEVYVKDGYIYKVFEDVASYLKEAGVSVHTEEIELTRINNTQISIPNEVLSNIKQNSHFGY